ncbi:MAG: DUF4416 family protein [Sedimentisphaerales bacterium]|nr:DUF4416 family protein [Sedimentisphaerales bacterium]
MSQQLHPPGPVKLVVGMLCGDRALLDEAITQMAARWGSVDVRSAVMEFGQTRYYEAEMGAGLLRQFVSFARLIDPGELARIKHESNTLEESLGATELGAALGVARPINLDPGYVEASKLVLATTKNYSHRIYIGESMYAEATLHYHRGKWTSWPYTYPDYGSGAYDGFLSEARRILMEQLSSQKYDI